MHAPFEGDCDCVVAQDLNAAPAAAAEAQAADAAKAASPVAPAGPENRAKVKAGKRRRSRR